MKNIYKIISLLSLALLLSACGSSSKDTDTDKDGVADKHDAFPQDARESKDTDGDGVGDNSDIFPTDATETTDTDGDTIGDNKDNCLIIANTEQNDKDFDLVGNACDAFPENPLESHDSDSDGTGDNSDAFPLDATETVDTDGDTIGDNSDNCLTIANTDQAEQDLDTVGDACDAFPLDATETLDTDNDGTGDNSDVFPTDDSETIDTDNDTIGNNADNCPNIANINQLNTDANFENGDAFGDACDADIDGDNVLNAPDIFPLDPAESIDEDTDQIGDNKDLDTTSPNNQVENSISLTRLVQTGRATRFIGPQADTFHHFSKNKVVNAGDVNHDGFDDMLVSFPGYKQDPEGEYYTGIVYLFFGGQAAWPATIDLNNIPDSVPHVIFEKQSADVSNTLLGLHMAALGDVNNDDIDDFSISATSADSSNVMDVGAVHIVYGRTTWLADAEAAVNHIISYASLKADYALNFYGELTIGFFGDSVANVGDVNGDGLADIAMGQSRFNSDTDTLVGRVYILFGGSQFAKPTSAANTNINITALTEAQRMRITGSAQLDLVGQDIQHLGNFDNDADNTDDLLLRSKEGKEYKVILGQENPPANITLDALIPNHGFVIKTDSTTSMVTVGHLVADDTNTQDLLITRSNKLYIIKGGVGNWPALLDLSDLAAEYVSQLPFTPSTGSGRSITMLPDSNQDGLDEPLISSKFTSDDIGRIQKIEDTNYWITHSSTAITVNTNIQNIINDAVVTTYIDSLTVLGDMNNDGQVEFVLNAYLTETINGTLSGDFFVVKGFSKVYP